MICNLGDPMSLRHPVGDSRQETVETERKCTVELVFGLGLAKKIRLKMSIKIQNGILNVQNSG